MNDVKIHRSSPSLDLISMAIDVHDDDDRSTTNVELSKKRISSNYGWDHYGSCKDKYSKNKYQLWREGKKTRSTISTIDIRQLSKISLHTTFSSITEHSNESTSTSTSSSGFETEDDDYYHYQWVSKVIPSVRKVRTPN